VGRAIALELGARGARVAVHYNASREGADEVVAALRESGAEAELFRADLSDPGAAAALVQDVHGWAPLHALVNSAAIMLRAPVHEVSLEQWDRMFAINLTSAYLATRALLPLLRRRRGSIVYFGSTAVVDGGESAGMAGYAAAKSGVLALMRTVAQEEAEHGVRANAVAPVAVRTAANLATMGSGVRYVEREEVATVVKFLCSPDAARITSQVLVLG